MQTDYKILVVFDEAVLRDERKKEWTQGTDCVHVIKAGEQGATINRGGLLINEPVYQLLARRSWKKGLASVTRVCVKLYAGGQGSYNDAPLDIRQDGEVAESERKDFVLFFDHTGKLQWKLDSVPVGIGVEFMALAVTVRFHTVPREIDGDYYHNDAEGA
jgi:hypothetical protein